MKFFECCHIQTYKVVFAGCEMPYDNHSCHSQGVYDNYRKRATGKQRGQNFGSVDGRRKDT
jgi:hypothetical protein